MSWRIVVIENQTKLSYKNGYLVICNDNTQMIHLSEIHTVIIDSTTSVISTYLLNKLVEEKIKIVFCDEKHHPLAEFVPYYGGHNTSKRVLTQLNWSEQVCDSLWTELIKKKIFNQRMILFNNNFKSYSFLDGYITQKGIHHRNEFNYYNLAYDFIEPLRCYIDNYVIEHDPEEFDKEYKHKMIASLNEKITFDKKSYSMKSAIRLYVQSLLRYLENDGKTELTFIEYL